ncbi:aquaporin-like protein [Melampsora americana]|nr:aquaporin-like protein [Melampsora americana]
MNDINTFQSTLPRRNFRLPTIIIHCIAEFIGVFLYVLPGEAATAAFLLSSANKTIGLGGLWNIGIAYSCGIVLAITLVAHVSGAHLSPGVTITFAALKGFPLWKVGPYILSQLLGAIAATLCIYGVYGHSFQAIEQGMEQAGRSSLIFSPSGPVGVGAILPAASQNLAQIFFGELLIGIILGLIMFGALDAKNPLLSHSSIPFLIAMAYLIAIIGFGPNTVVLNTARGLGGQIATSMIYGRQVFENSSFIAMATLTNIPATMIGGLLYKCVLEIQDPVSSRTSPVPDKVKSAQEEV